MYSVATAYGAWSESAIEKDNRFEQTSDRKLEVGEGARDGRKERDETFEREAMEKKKG